MPAVKAKNQGKLRGKVRGKEEKEGEIRGNNQTALCARVRNRF